MTRYTPFNEFYKNLVEKKDPLIAKTRMEKCIEYVTAKGGKEAGKVCAAMLSEDAYKNMGDGEFDKEVDEFMRTLGISGAGPVPNSLLARQDLEAKEWELGAHKSFSKAANVLVRVQQMKADGSLRMDILETLLDEGYSRLEIMAAIDKVFGKSIEKAGTRCWVVRCNGGDYGVYDKKTDAEDACEMLTAQGTFAIMVEQTVVDSADKAAGDSTDVWLVRAGGAEQARFATRAEAVEFSEMLEASGVFSAVVKESIVKSDVAKSYYDLDVTIVYESGKKENRRTNWSGPNKESAAYGLKVSMMNYAYDNEPGNRVKDVILNSASLHKSTASADGVIRVSYISSSGKLMMREFNSRAAYNSFISTVGDQIRVTNVWGLDTTKGVIESTGRVLNEALKDAPNADTRSERSSIVENIQEAQMKRQKATIAARAQEGTQKSFKETWKSLKSG